MPAQQNTERATGSSSYVSPRAAPFESRFVEAGGLKLHCLDYGTEGCPPMLGVHGSAAHAHWYDFVAKGFTADYHVRAVDLRGHGDSEWPNPPSYFYQEYASDLHQVIETLDLRDLVLIGHSMGGAISLLYAATYPERVKALIVVDSTVNLSADRIAQMRDVGTRPGRSYATQDELVSGYRLRPGESWAAPEVVRHVAAFSGRQGDEGAWKYKFDRNVYATRELSNGMPNWDRIKVPALLVKGDRSDRLNSPVFAEVKRRCPQVELVEVSGSGHHVTLDNPEGFVQAVKPWLSRARV